jgi:hypothetical protein
VAPDGLDYHVCFLADGNVRVNEIWDSRSRWKRSESDLCRCWMKSGSTPASRRSWKSTTSLGARRAATRLPAVMRSEFRSTLLKAYLRPGD